MKRFTLIFIILASVCCITGITANAQQKDFADNNQDTGNNERPKPGTTFRPENTENWTDEMFRQWEEDIRKKYDTNEPIKEKPVIETPDFSKMTEPEIKAWEDSVINILYPPLTLFTYDPSTGEVIEKPNNEPSNNIIELRSGFTNSHVPISAAIDHNKLVGDIPMTSAVLPNGALTYQIPIDIYPGVNGFQPNLSLSYNSFSGNGLMGVGWNMDGLSFITRVAKNLYYENKTEGALMDKSDPFVLDGLRLIKTSENSSEINYETERGNIKATAYINGNIVLYFKVWHPNGNTAIYGYTNNASSLLEYPLTELQDRFNNTITYNYAYGNNHYMIQSIIYGYASVVFNYNPSRPDNPFYYRGGIKVTLNNLLSSVECRFGSNVLRKYDISYINHKTQAVISQVDLLGESLSLNPLKFYYGENNTAYNYLTTWVNLYQSYSFTWPDEVITRRGKFDYFSEDDGIIVLPTKLPYFNEIRDPGLFQHSRNRYINLYTGNEEILLYTELNDPDSFGYIFPSMPTLTTEEGFIDILCANIDGKYDDEIIKINNTVINNTYEKVVFKVYSSSLYFGIELSYTREYLFPTVITDNDNGYSVHPKFYYTGDFIGNGKMQVLAVSCANPGGQNINSRCYLFDLENDVILYEDDFYPFFVDFIGTYQTNPSDAKANTDHFTIIDYDGDGKSDIYHHSNYGDVYTFEFTGSTYIMKRVARSNFLARADYSLRELLVGDFNGDGLTDFLLTSNNDINFFNFTWSYYYSKGNGQFEIVNVTGFSYTKNMTVFAQDINGDGIPDLISTNPIGGSGFYTYFINPNQTIILDSYTIYPYHSAILPVDINGNNYVCRIVNLKDSLIYKYTYPRDDKKEMLLTGAVNSFGVIERNHFLRLNESNQFYQKGSGATWPFINFQGPIYIPVNREQYYNSQLYNDINLYYENAVLHRQGLGFCGFSRINTYDNIRYNSTSQTFNPYQFGIKTGDENPVHKTINNWSVNIQPNKIAIITLENQSVQHKLKGITQTASYLYDSYGNPTNETINFGENITQTINNVYYNNTGSPYILGALIDHTVTVTRGGASNSKRMYISSHNHGLPLTTVIYANGLQTSETTKLYNSQGLITNVNIRPYNSSNVLTHSTAYDIYGRVTQINNPLGLYTTFEYNSFNGLLQMIKDHKSQGTIIMHDNLARRVGAIYPNGVQEYTQFAWSSGPGLYDVNYTVAEQPNITISYDAFERDVRKSVIRFNGTVEHIDKTYDSSGRLYQQSLPFTGSTASYWDTYLYDFYDRPTSITYASGNSITYSYSGKNVTVTKNGISSTHNYDAQGNLTSVSDLSGTITYNLRPDGQPSNITVPGNITTTFGYDSYGRQTSINDPSAGNRIFTYDAAGNLQSETNANNLTKTMSYDVYGRLTSKVLPEFTTTYGYNSDGLLASETSTNNTSRTYQYDTYGRLYKDRDNGPDSYWLEKTFSYSSENIYSIGFAAQSGTIGTEYYLYSNGFLSEIKLDNTSVWNLISEHSTGQANQVTTGPVTRVYSYDSYGISTGRTATVSNFGTLLNHTYSFDNSKGNLSFRKDNTRNLQENFTFDNLNRLKTFSGFIMDYDLKGNITKKSDAGNTFYFDTPNKPYAISGVDAGGNTAIPQRNQSVTYTSFDRPSNISENNYEALFTYANDGSRKKMQMKQYGNTLFQRYYLGDRYEADFGTSVNKQKLYIGGDAYTAPAVYVNQGSGWVLHYILRDYLGSITHVTNSSGAVTQETSFDAWGRVRNPVNQIAYLPDYEPDLFLNRGYTGHEHLPQFGLINMNARLYDPALGRFLSPDPYVQAPDFSQNFNRYSYALNNPLRYTDLDGEFFLTFLFLFHTDAGYQLQKFISPVAVHADLRFGTHQTGIGFDAGFGVPKTSPVAPWKEYGKTYFWENYGDYKGWETRKGTETTYFGFYTSGKTEYDAGEFSQTVGYRKLGIPGNAGFDVYNDLWGDEGDRFRTSRVRLNFGPLYLENVIFTGDRGMNPEDQYKIDGGPHGTWAKKPGDPYAPDPDKYRHGVLSLGIGPISFGNDSEWIRDLIQNQIVHRLIGSTYFRYMEDRKDRLYFQFGAW